MFTSRDDEARFNYSLMAGLAAVHFEAQALAAIERMPDDEGAGDTYALAFAAEAALRSDADYWWRFYVGLRE